MSSDKNQNQNFSTDLNLNALENPRVLSLDSHVIDQIAAGEVLERPAHMIKELIENAIDAGSTDIELRLGEGGRSLTLIDNGFGFNPEDLKLALQRHTTSKLKSSNDLWQLSTYGFRGEALASISAVSNMNIRTHRRGEKCVELKSHFGVVDSIIDSNLDFGTQIEISDLYQNTPARLKFLKTDAAEVMEIKKVLFAFGLCQPHVGIKLFFRDQLEYYWPKIENDLNLDALKRRNQNILKTNELFIHKKDYGDIQVEVHLAPPHETAKSNRKLWVFVQNRWVQEPMILSAIRDGFQNSLLPHEYPMGAVFVSVAKDFVDVNVHPTKSKVKFKDSSVIYRAVRNTIMDFVEKSPWRHGFLNSESSLKESEYNTYSDYLNTNGYINSKTSDGSLNNKSQIKNYFHNVSSNDDNPVNQQTGFELKAFRSQNKSLNNFTDSKFGSEFSVLNTDSAAQNHDSSQAYAPSGRSQAYAPLDQSLWSNLLVIGQVAKTYIVTQNQAEIIYIDQHAAHERCLFEKLWQRFKKGSALETQRHLLPLTFKVDDESLIEAFLKNATSLEKLGILFEQSGPTQIEITETPAIIKDSAILKSLTLMSEQILELGQSFIFEDVVSDIFATMACHSAIRAGQILTVPEMEELLDLMDDYSTTSYCPHGRPVFVRHSFNQLEKEFCRKV